MGDNVAVITLGNVGEKETVEQAKVVGGQGMEGEEIRVETSDSCSAGFANHPTPKTTSSPRIPPASSSLKIPKDNEGNPFHESTDLMIWEKRITAPVMLRD